MRGPKYRLSPNEIEHLVKEERERRRKLRILQVREQAKANATTIRNDVRRAKVKLLSNLASEIKEKLEAEKEEQIRKLGQKYDNTLRAIGEGHREAHLHGDGENRTKRLHQLKEDELAALERYKQAMELKKRQDNEEEYKKNKHISARKAALEVEKERAAQVASLPAPPPDVSVELERIKRKAIPMTDMKAFATTHYHIPDYQVVRAGAEEQHLYDAKTQGEETDLKLRQDLVETKRSRHEQIERARIRGNEALQKEMLKNDLGDMMKDLSLLQKKDRRRRQAIVSDLPKQVFIPPEKCLEERKEKQIEMERKFDELYIQHCKVDAAEDLRGSDVSDYPTIQDSTDSYIPELDATPDISIPLSQINPALRDLTNVSRPTNPTQMKKPATVLRELLNRIKEQRDTTKESPDNKAETEAGEHMDTLDVSKQDLQTDNKDSLLAENKVEKLILEKEADGYGSSGEHEFGSQPKTDQAAMARNETVGIAHKDKMIEDLRKRIELIESQKKQLSEQFLAQASFHRHLFTAEELVSDEDEGSTLKEVDIEEFQLMSGKMDQPRNNTSKMYLEGKSENLKQLSGILKETKHKIVSDEDGGHFVPPLWPGQSIPSQGIHARREIHLGGNVALGNKAWQDSGNLRFQPLPYVGQQQSSLASQGIPGFRSDHGVGRIYQSDGVTCHQDDNAKDRPLGHLSDVSVGGWDVSQKLKDYSQGAMERLATMDEDTIKKVREYQSKLLETHAQRKKLLSDVQADIERRRNELKLSSCQNIGTQRVGSTLKLAADGGDVKVTSSGGPQPKQWETIKPFIAEPWRRSNPSEVASHRDYSNFGTETKLIRSSVGFKEPGKSDSGENFTVEENKMDKIRKSLSFQELGESPNISCISWNDTPVSRQSQGVSESSRLTSSEEERGSPVLPIRAPSSDSFSAALVERAEANKREFHQRQQEIQAQLMEMQKQKEMILQRYNAGQLALQQQQMAVKYLNSVTTDEKDNSPPVDKFEGARSKINPQPRGGSDLRISWDVASVPCEERDFSRGFRAIRSRSSECLDDSRESEATSGRQSLSTPGNLSADSYLADISYHKIKSADAGGVPTSAFRAPEPATSVATQSYSNTQQPTWASLLMSASNSKLQPLDAQHQKLTGPPQVQTSPQQPYFIQQQQLPQWQPSQPQQGVNPRFEGDDSVHFSDSQSIAGRSSNISRPSGMSDKSGLEHTIESMSNSLSDSLFPSPGLSDRLPHELSTILEVDTPLSASSKTPARKLPVIPVASILNMRNASSIITSSGLQSYRLGPGVKIDILRDPYTFPPLVTAGPHRSEFNLATGQRLQDTDAVNEQDISKTSEDQDSTGLFRDIPGETKPLVSRMGAKRTLNFSEDPNEMSPQNFDNLIDEEEDLSSTKMPALVDLTPIKPWNQVKRDNPMEVTSAQREVSGTSDGATSSLNITGYSDYVKEREATIMSTPDLSTSGADHKQRSGEGSGCEETKKITDVLQQAQTFDQELLSRLQLQSQAVFGDKTGNTTEYSEMSGNLSSMTASNLEEVTIPDHTNDAADSSDNNLPKSPIG